MQESYNQPRRLVTILWHHFEYNIISSHFATSHICCIYSSETPHNIILCM